MTDWQSGDILANNIRIHYHRTGGGKPPIVLSHGITDSGLGWTRTARALEQDYDLIMLDARGHGGSDAPETGYTSEERAADVAGVIQALGLVKPYLMGHSMGADTSGVAAALYPDLVGGLVLEDPPWFAGLATPDGREAITADLHAKMLARASKSVEELIAAGRELHPSWDDVELAPWAAAKKQVSSHALQMITELRPHWRETVPRIACRTLLITADPELGSLVGPEVTAEFVAANPLVTVAHVAGAGHNIRREGFEAYVAAVKGFLAPN